MDKTTRINAVIRFVESHVKEKISYTELEKAIGVSYRHLREEFRYAKKIPLGQYINTRKIANIAYQMETTDKTLTHIAADYGFEAYDTFTRAFKRETGITPNEYRRQGIHGVQRRLIGMGAYAPVIVMEKTPAPKAAPQKDACVLYGVPPLAFSSGKCIPLIACLETALAYTGRRGNASYPWLAAASGAAFRFTWKAGEWDMGNSDIKNMNAQNPWEAAERAFAFAGRRCRVLRREGSSKETFKKHIVSHIDKGTPVIALGIVGPPEACLITGYRRNGEQLLGQSYFQDLPECSAGVTAGPSGYFAASGWWENPATTALLLPDGTARPPSIQEVLRHIHAVLTANTSGAYHTGQQAYNSWARDVANDDAFRDKNITPLLLNQFFCQADAETMIGEGRYWGARFFEALAKPLPEHAGLCAEIAALLDKTANAAQRMTAVRRGGEQTEEAVRIFFRPETRKEIAALIYEARDWEKKAADKIGVLFSE